MQPDETFLVQQARMVLDFNWTGEYTRTAQCGSFLTCSRASGRTVFFPR